jgi:CRP-like cAMP-binding protein
MNPKRNTLNQISIDTLLMTPLFRAVPRDQAAQLLPHLQSKIHYKGDVLFAEHEIDSRMFFIEAGRVKLIKTAKDGRVELLSIHGRGEMLGEIAVFDPEGGPRTASAVVMTDGTRIAGLSREDLFAWLHEHTNIAINMLQVMANRMRKNNDRLADLVFTDVPGRLAKTLLDLAVRFGTPDSRGLAVPHELTQEELAELVGSSRETVNKALMEFTNRGWIQRQGRTIIIFQPGKLIRRAQ